MISILFIARLVLESMRKEFPYLVAFLTYYSPIIIFASFSGKSSLLITITFTLIG